MKRREIEEKINFSIPLSVCKGIVNDDGDVLDKNISDFKVDYNKMYIQGIAATPDLDLDKQKLKPSGFILDYFLQSGFLNWNHQGAVSPDAIIGEPIDAKVTNEDFFIKGKLYSWSNLAKSVYDVAVNLENDPDTDRTLGYSVEGLALETEDEYVSKLLVTGCACCFVPKNNKTYLQICKGVTVEQVRDLRKQYLFKPVYEEVEKGVTTQYILNLKVGNRRILVDMDYNFHIKNDYEGYNNNNISLEDLQKSIVTLSLAYKEGLIKESKKDELLKIIEAKRKLLIK
jgi:hypothetical protein